MIWKGIGDNDMLRANYGDMVSSAKKISDAANNYILSLNKFYSVVDELSTVWTGSDKNQFVNTVESYKVDIANLGEIVNNYANFLITTANRLNETQSNVYNSAGRL